MLKILKQRAVLALVMAGLLCKTQFAQAQPVNTHPTDPWVGLDAVLGQIKAPVFPDKDFVVTSYGAVADGRTNCGKAIKAAIEACNAAGGGRVVVPPGKYFTGPIYLKSNVNLHLEKGATLLFSTEPDNYLPIVHTRWEGVEVMNYSPLVYAYQEHDIAITGEGVLDGQASSSNWWPWKGIEGYGWVPGTPNQTDNDKRPALLAMAEKDVPVADRKFGKGFYLRPQFVQPFGCQNVLIEGVTIKNSPMWILHPVLSNNITINKVTVESDGPNTDGCDPESCRNVLIKECFFNTGDDCIALKSGRNRDGRRINIPCENVVIQNCTMANGHGGIVIGSEISGGANNIFAENCKMSSPHLDIALRIKTSTARGGIIQNVFVRNITVGQVAGSAILITKIYEDKGAFMPIIRNIQVKNMVVQKGGKTGISLTGYPESPITDLVFTDLTIKGALVPFKATGAANIVWDNTYINGQQMQ